MRKSAKEMATSATNAAGNSRHLLFARQNVATVQDKAFIKTHHAKSAVRKWFHMGVVGKIISTLGEPIGPSFAHL